ncbi:hypothetical protein G4B88_010692 [Cannabis sativa]|uniref:BED-type domain-containing protein n=1 Tax=Cannabis sativa TaxID=3483 RepID=A0A7J6EQI3_CANSA|nr:hypothetical protein G4B88_010692 [Cannabis sativa]
MTKKSLLMENEEENVDDEVQKWIQSVESEEKKKAKIKIPQKRKRQGTRTSGIWDHFTIVKKMVKGANGKEEERERAQCNYCEADYAADSKNCGPSTLWRNIEHKCKQCPFNTYVQKHTKQGMIFDYFTKTIQDSEIVVLPNSSNDQQTTENATFKSNASSKESCITSTGTEITTTTTSGALNSGRFIL